MAINITTRLGKGSALTYQELDDNFTSIKDWIENKHIDIDAPDYIILEGDNIIYYTGSTPGGTNAQWTLPVISSLNAFPEFTIINDSPNAILELVIGSGTSYSIIDGLISHDPYIIQRGEVVKLKMQTNGNYRVLSKY